MTAAQMVDAPFTMPRRASFTLLPLGGGVRTGKLSISRGHRAGEAPPGVPRLALVPREALPPSPVGARPVAPAARAAPPVTQEYQPAHDRLAALERLARLHKQGALTADEFAFEKARIIAGPASELLLQQPAPPTPPAPGPSLTGRLLDWRLLMLGAFVGLGLSFASQPQETIRFFDDLIRLLGA